MPDQQGPEVVIVGTDGTEHVFPAGFDPKRAAAIVRGQNQAATPTSSQPGVLKATTMGGAAMAPRWSRSGLATQQLKPGAELFSPDLLPAVGAALATAYTAGGALPLILAAGGGGAAGSAVKDTVTAGANGYAPSAQTSGDVFTNMLKEGGTQAALQGVGELASAVPGILRAAGRKLYQSALKPTKAVLARTPGYGTRADQEAARDVLVNRGLQDRIRVSQSGAQRAENIADALDAQRHQMIDQSTATVSPVPAAARLQRLEGTFQGSFPQEDKTTIKGLYDRFTSDPRWAGAQYPVAPNGQPIIAAKPIGTTPRNISAPDAADVLTSSNRELRGKIQQYGNARVEGEKAAAQGWRDAIADAVPGTKPLARHEAELISLQEALGDAARRHGNWNISRLPEVIAGAAHSPVVFGASLLDRPGIKSSLGIGANRLGNALPQAGGDAWATMLRAALLSQMNEGR